MNVRLQFETDLLASIFYDGQIRNNHYRIKLSFMTVGMDAHEQNIALERIRYMINYCFDSTVMIQDTEQETIVALTQAGHKLAILPEPPVDQIIGIMLYCKLNAVAEDRLVVTEVTVSSRLGDNVAYLHDDEDVLGPFAKEGWWNDPDVRTISKNGIKSGNKIVTISRSSAWADLGLDWGEPDDSTQDNNTVVFGRFNNDEN